MKAYEDGRYAIQIGLFKVMTSIIKDTLGTENLDIIKKSVTNVINRETLRPEDRPDPKGKNSKLANELINICGLQMIKEAFATILILDVCLGEIKSKDANYNKLNKLKY